MSSDLKYQIPDRQHYLVFFWPRSPHPRPKLSPGPCQLNAGLEMVQVTFTERHEVYTFSQNITNMTNMQQVTLLPEQIPMLEPQEGHLRSWTSPGGLLTGTSTRALLLPSFLGCLLLSPQRLRIQNSDLPHPTIMTLCRSRSIRKLFKGPIRFQIFSLQGENN